MRKKIVLHFIIPFFFLIVILSDTERTHLLTIVTKTGDKTRQGTMEEQFFSLKILANNDTSMFHKQEVEEKLM